MMRNRNLIAKAVIFGLLCTLTNTLAAQASAPVDFMRSLGKMYVVVGVIVLIFLGLISWLWYLDRRLTKIEDQSISDE